MRLRHPDQITISRVGNLPQPARDIYDEIRYRALADAWSAAVVVVALLGLFAIAAGAATGIGWLAYAAVHAVAGIFS